MSSPQHNSLVQVKVLFVYLYVVYLTIRFINLEYMESNERVISEWWIGEDFDGSGRGLI
jgi:hypothetical protein